MTIKVVPKVLLLPVQCGDSHFVGLKGFTSFLRIKTLGCAVLNGVNCVNRIKHVFKICIPLCLPNIFPATFCLFKGLSPSADDCPVTWTTNGVRFMLIWGISGQFWGRSWVERGLSLKCPTIWIWNVGNYERCGYQFVYVPSFCAINTDGVVITMDALELMQLKQKTGNAQCFYICSWKMPNEEPLYPMLMWP